MGEKSHRDDISNASVNGFPLRPKIAWIFSPNAPEPRFHRIVGGIARQTYSVAFAKTFPAGSHTLGEFSAVEIAEPKRPTTSVFGPSVLVISQFSRCLPVIGWYDWRNREADGESGTVDWDWDRAGTDDKMVTVEKTIANILLLICNELRPVKNLVAGRMAKDARKRASNTPQQ